MKKTKTLVGGILGIMFFGFGWNQIRTHETTLVVLKCVYQIEENKEKKNVSNYYKITKRPFEDSPYKLYISNPHYDEKDVSPYLIGVSIQSARDSDKLNLKSRPYLPPDWYTFIPERKEGVFFLPTATYVNRVTLQMEDLSLDNGESWSKSSCSIVESNEFDDDYKSKVESKRKEQRF